MRLTPDPWDSELLGHLVDQTFRAVAVIDPETGTILYLNREASSILGIPQDRAVGASAVPLIHPDDLMRSARVFGRLQRGELTRFAFSKRIRASDGSWRTYSTVSNRVVLPDGKAVVVIQVDDLTRGGVAAALIRMIAERPDGSELASAILDGVLAEFNVHTVVLRARDPEAEELRLRGFSTRWGPLPRPARGAPLSLVIPDTDVWRTGIEYRQSVAETVRDYPFTHPSLKGIPDEGTVCVIPVHARGKIVGVCEILSSEPLEDTWSLRHILDTVAAGLSCWFMMLDAEEIEIRGASERLGFTDRQKEILQLVEEGWSNRSISQQLGFSEGTVRADLQKLSKLWGVSGRGQIVATARRMHLID